MGDESAAANNLVYPLWWIIPPILRVLSVARELAAVCGGHYELRLQAKLLNVSKVPFTLSFSDPRLTTAVYTLPHVAPARTNCPSELSESEILAAATELLYQLRWLFGTQTPHTREQVRLVVEREFQSSQIPLSTSF
jgi:hypothetical protein